MDAELEVVWPLASQVWDLVPDIANGLSCSAAMLSTAAELLEGCVDTTVANGIRRGTRSVLVATLLHFP
jgi:hypothetical protein